VSADLTVIELAIVEFVVDYRDANGYPPSVREIGAEIGWSSPATVQHHLRTLERKGVLVRDESKPRAIRVLHDLSTDSET
jgi:repressor LexA